MHVALYFGSFNPIHHGHLLIADYAACLPDVQQVWFVVSPQNPFKPSKSLLNEYHRLHFVNLAIEGDTRFKANDIEFKLERPSYTSVTLAYLSQQYPNHEFSVLLGSDSYQNLNRWHNAHFIKKNYNLLIFNRLGSEIQDANGLTILNAPILDISATAIREKVTRGETVRYYLPEAVAAEIERNNYYK